MPVDTVSALLLPWYVAGCSRFFPFWLSTNEKALFSDEQDCGSWDCRCGVTMVVNCRGRGQSTRPYKQVTRLRPICLEFNPTFNHNNDLHHKTGLGCKDWTDSGTDNDDDNTAHCAVVPKIVSIRNHSLAAVKQTKIFAHENFASYPASAALMPLGANFNGSCEVLPAAMTLVPADCLYEPCACSTTSTTTITPCFIQHSRLRRKCKPQSHFPSKKKAQRLRPGAAAAVAMTSYVFVEGWHWRFLQRWWTIAFSSTTFNSMPYFRILSNAPPTLGVTSLASPGVSTRARARTISSALPWGDFTRVPRCRRGRERRRRQQRPDYPYKKRLPHKWLYQTFLLPYFFVIYQLDGI